MTYIAVKQAFLATRFISLGGIPSEKERKKEAADKGFVITIRAGKARPI